jgi:CHAT domain
VFPALRPPSGSTSPLAGVLDALATGEPGRARGLPDALPPGSATDEELAQLRWLAWSLSARWWPGLVGTNVDNPPPAPAEPPRPATPITAVLPMAIALGALACGGLTRLPGAAVEAVTVARALGASPLVGADAGAAAVRAGLATAGGVAHFATHGRLDADAPHLSALVLAGRDELTVAQLLGADSTSILPFCRPATPDAATSPPPATSWDSPAGCCRRGTARGGVALADRRPDRLPDHGGDG